MKSSDYGYCSLSKRRPQPYFRADTRSTTRQKKNTEDTKKIFPNYVEFGCGRSGSHCGSDPERSVLMAGFTAKPKLRLIRFIKDSFPYQIFNPVRLQKFLHGYKMSATVLEVFQKSPHFQNPGLLSGGEQTT